MNFWKFHAAARCVCIKYLNFSSLHSWIWWGRRGRMSQMREELFALLHLTASTHTLTLPESYFKLQSVRQLTSYSPFIINRKFERGKNGNSRMLFHGSPCTPAPSLNGNGRTCDGIHSLRYVRREFFSSKLNHEIIMCESWCGGKSPFYRSARERALSVPQGKFEF